MKEYIPGQGSYKVEEAGALTGIPSSYDVDTHFGSLTFRRDDVAIKARGVDLALSSTFNSDHLYSTIMPLVSKSDGPAGAGGTPVPGSLMTLPPNQSNLYRLANGWSWNLPYLMTGATATGDPQPSSGGGASAGWNLFKYFDGNGRIFDLVSALSQEAWLLGKGNHTWTEGYEVTFAAEVTALGGSTPTNGTGVLGYSRVTIVIPEIQQVVVCWVIRSGSAIPFDFSPAMTTGFTPLVYLSDGRSLKFSVKGLAASTTDAAGKNSVNYSYVAGNDSLIGSVVGTLNQKTFALAAADYATCSAGDLVMIGDEIKVILAKIGPTAAGTCTVYTSSSFDVTLAAGTQYTIVKGQLQMMTHTDGRAVKFYYYNSGSSRMVVTMLSSDQVYNNFNTGDQFLAVYTIDAINQLWRFQAVNSLGPGNSTTFPASLAASPSTYFTLLQQITYGYKISLTPSPSSDSITVTNHAGAPTIYYFQTGGFCTHSWNNSFFHSGSCRRGGTSTIVNIERPDFPIGSSFNYLSINRIDQRAFYSASKADYQKDVNAAEFQEDSKSASALTTDKYNKDAYIAAHAPAVSAWQLVTKQVSSSRVLLSAPLSVAPLQNDVYGCVQLRGQPDMNLRVNASSQDTTKIYIDFTNGGVGSPLQVGDYLFIRGYMAQIQGVGTDTWQGAAQRYVLTTDPLPFSAAEGEYVIAVYLTGGKIPNPQTHYGYYLNKPKCVRIEFRNTTLKTRQKWKQVDYSYMYNIQGMTQTDSFDSGGFDVSFIEGPQPSSFALSDIKLNSTTVTTSVAGPSSLDALHQELYTFAYDVKNVHQGTESDTQYRFDPASSSWLFVAATKRTHGRPCFNAAYWGPIAEVHYAGGDVTNLANGGASPRKEVWYRFDVYGRKINEKLVSNSFEGRRIRNQWFQYCCTSQDPGQSANWDLDPLLKFSENYFSSEYRPLMTQFHALGVVAATIEEVDAEQTEKMVIRKFDPVYFNLLVEDTVVKPTLVSYSDLYSVNSPNWNADLNGTITSNPASLRWSADKVNYSSDLTLLQIGEGAVNAHLVTMFRYDVGSGSNNTNQLLTTTRPKGNSYSVTYGTGWASSFVASDWKTLPNNVGGTTQYVVNLYSYDLKGRLAAKTTVLSTDTAGSLPFTYGSSAPKTKVQYTYDGLDRVLTKLIGDGTTQTLVYQAVYVDSGDGTYEGPYLSETDYLGFRTKTLYDTKYRVVATQKYKPSKGVGGATGYANSLMANGLCNQSSAPPSVVGQSPAPTAFATFTQSLAVGSPGGITGSAFLLTKSSVANTGLAQAFFGPSSTTNLSGLSVSRTYLVGAWVYVPVQVIQNLGTFVFSVAYYNAGAWTSVSASPSANYAVWQPLSLTVTIPATATGVVASLQIGTAEAAGTALYCSDLTLQDVTVASEVVTSAASQVYDEGLDKVTVATRYTTPARLATQSVITQNTYDTMGRLLQVAYKNTDPTFQGDSVYHVMTQYKYDERLNIVSTFDFVDDDAVDYRRTDVYQDWLGRGAIKVVTYTGLGGTGLTRNTTNHYRHDGKLIQTDLPNGDSYYFQYDNLGKLEKQTYADGTEDSYLYDLNGNLVQTIDRRNISVSRSYNSSDLEVTKTTVDTNVGPWPNRGTTAVSTLYTQFGPAQVLKTENGLPVVQETWQYHFSGKVNLRQQLVFETAGLPAPFAATALVAGTQYTIATLGTTNFVTYGAASNTVGTIFTATGVGTGTGTVYLTAMLQVAYGYDPAGNLIGLTPVGSGVSPWTNGFTVVPQYYPNGTDTDNFNRVAVVDTAASKNVITVEPNFLGLVTDYKYGTYATPAGQMNYTYDLFLRPRTLVSSEATPVLNLTLTRDFVGDIVNRTEPANAPAPALNYAYTYDGMKRLTSGEGDTEAYDELSNLVARAIGVAYTYQDPNQPGTDQMRLATFSDGTNTYGYTYDADGNPTSISKGSGWKFNSLSYDYLNHLRQAVAAKTDNYWYNNAGLRVKKTENVGGTWQTTYTLFEGINPLMQETYTAAGRVQTTFNVIVDGKILAQYKKVYPSAATSVYFYLDHLGSRRVVLSSAGAVLDRYRYSAWGVLTQDAGTDGYGSFTGKDYDATGLIYFNARYYDPVVARFLTEDPAKKGVGWYNYCENDPVNRTDPTGLWTFGAFVGFGPALSLTVGANSDQVTFAFSVGFGLGARTSLNSADSGPKSTGTKLTAEIVGSMSGAGNSANGTIQASVNPDGGTSYTPSTTFGLGSTATGGVVTSQSGDPPVGNSSTSGNLVAAPNMGSQVSATIGLQTTAGSKALANTLGNIWNSIMGSLKSSKDTSSSSSTSQQTTSTPTNTTTKSSDFY